MPNAPSFTKASVLMPSGDVIAAPLNISVHSAENLSQASMFLLAAENVDRLWVLVDDGTEPIGKPVRRLLFVDELAHDKRLPVNRLATAYYRQYMAMAFPKAEPSVLPSIAGAAVLFHDEIAWSDPA
jgi:hypothetical protein